MKQVAAKRVFVECSTPANWREFRRILTIGVTSPIGRIDSDGSVVILRPERFANLLAACEGRIIGAAQCDDCQECRPPTPSGGPVRP